MTTIRNLVAIGRSRYLYNSIAFLFSKGFKFKALVTEEAYDEYDVKSADFRTLADSIGANFFQTSDLENPDLLQLIKENDIRVAISANWKYRISEEFLGLFEIGILNFHLGNLPDYKGNATVNWSIINGERHITANIHKMDPEIDAGDIISRKPIPITSDTYISEIVATAETVAPALFAEALSAVENDRMYYLEKGEVTGLRCYPRIPEDSQINWNDNMDEISRLIRASARPYRGAYSFLNGTKVTIWKAKPHVSNHRYLAMPGHIIERNRKTENILVVCKNGLIEIEQIEINGKVTKPARVIQSIRSRFQFLPNA